MKRTLNRLVLILSMALFEFPLMAQGVIVWKKDGTQMKFPYEEIDSIVTYNLGEDVEEDEPVVSPIDSRAVDLGLPSGLLWASCNVGAESPEEYGGYYAWGETEEKTDYSWSTYKWCNGSYYTQTKYCTSMSNGFVDNKTTLDLEDDVARVQWGDSWRMPTKVEQDELRTECDWEWTTVNGVNGYKVKSRVNDNFIFLPAAGKFEGSVFYSDGSYGYYWSATLNSGVSDDAYSLYFGYGGCNWNSYFRYDGRSVRPVTEKVEEDEPATPPSVANTYTVNGVSFKMIAVDGGTFTMGATYEQGNEAYDDELPRHQVTLSCYAIGETEVTQELWRSVTGNNPSYYTGDLQRPVELVSWNDCQTFIAKLNELTGENFRLPTEAEWEYAARGGNASEGYKYSGSNTIGDVAWFYDNSSSTTHAVKTKQPNELGIYDMSGNVYEWCADWFGDSYYASSPENNPTGPSSGSNRVLRGGCWVNDAGLCRVANRNSLLLDGRSYYYGLRLAQ